MICGNWKRASAAALLTIEHFVYRIGLNAGLLAAALGGLDAFVFTAGIGENYLPRLQHQQNGGMPYRNKRPETIRAEA